MSFTPNAFAPELRDLEKSTLDQMHATIHQKDMRNSDRLLIFSHLVDRYIEERAKIVMSLTKEVGETDPE